MKSKLEQPKIPSDLPDISDRMHALMTKDEFSHGCIEDITIHSQEAARVSFEKIVFRNVTIAESSLPDAELTDVIFEKCDLSNVDFAGIFLHRTEFRNCKLMGTDFTKSRLQHVSFLSCLSDYALFRFANFKQVEFEDCSLVSADYYQSSLNKTSFIRCKIDQAILSGVKLKGIDLSDCDFDELMVEIDDLRGCIISAGQASTFAGLLGLVIK